MYTLLTSNDLSSFEGDETMDNAVSEVTHLSASSGPPFHLKDFSNVTNRESSHKSSLLSHSPNNMIT